MKVQFETEHLATLEAHLEAGYPNEAAGFLLGRVIDNRFVVRQVLPLPNRWAEGSQANRFALDARDSLRAELEAERLGLSVIGVFHSHPDHPAEPSQWDLAWASWPNFSYLISTVEGGKVTRTRAWRLLEDRSAFVEDTITSDQNVTKGNA